MNPCFTIDQVLNVKEKADTNAQYEPRLKVNQYVITNRKTCSEQPGMT